MMSKSPETSQFRADTLIVSARVESFYDVFLAERAWYPIRIDDRRKSDLKWICVYQNNPVRAITHYARIIGIENHLETGRYRIVFGEPIDLPEPIALGSESGLSMQGHKYTNLERLLKAKSISDLKPWNQNASS
ncbi:TPA: hypothetical protein QDB07_006662 [Burkholderia vietnamiensis]|nr:hypothetical protein [Burkholderia vietnamiensis]